MPQTHKFNKTQKIDILENYIASGKSPSKTLADLRTLWGDRFLKINHISIKHIYNVFREYGAFEYQAKKTKVVRTPVNIQAVADKVDGAQVNRHSLSAGRIGPKVALSKTTWRILLHDLHMKPDL